MRFAVPPIFFAGTILPAHAQEELTVSAEEQTVIFLGFIIAVVAISVYLARDAILRKKTEYDEKKLGSQKNRDYDKYHSDWNDDYEDVGSRNDKNKKRFRRPPDYESLPDLYAILGIKKDATAEGIKRRYRILAKQSHPDKSAKKDAQDRMSEINTAYEILSDPQQRKEYDGYFTD